MYLFDTDAAIELLRGRNTLLATHVRKHATQIGISAVSVAELEYGAARSTHTEQSRRAIGEFLSGATVFPFDTAVAMESGRLRHTLRSVGKPIGPFDLLIAATALHHKLILVTGNTREFERVPGLICENWLREAQ